MFVLFLKMQCGYLHNYTSTLKQWPTESRGRRKCEKTHFITMDSFRAHCFLPLYFHSDLVTCARMAQHIYRMKVKISYELIIWLTSLYSITIIDLSSIYFSTYLIHVAIYNNALSKYRFWCGKMVKNPYENAGDARDMYSIPGLGRSPGVGNGNPFSILSWKIPWTEEPGRLQPMG